MSDQSLKGKTLKGTAWSAIDSVANQGITFLVGLVLARLLSPEEYGLIGIITIFISISTVFITSGFNSALIRKKDASDTDYNTVFYFNIIVSCIIYLLLFLGAPLIADFFKRSELVPLMRVMGVILFINALSLVQSTILTKQIDFKKQTKISLIASISSGCIGIGMAYNGYGIWSLAGQQISRQALNTLFLWLWSAWRPALTYSIKSFRELWQFGWKLLCSSLLDTAWKEVYQVVVGRCYSPATLGQYTRAQQFAGIFSVNLTSIIQRVSFPVLSSIQDDKVRLKEAYRRIIRISMLVTFVCMLVLAAIAKPLIVVLIGEKWLQCVGFLQIICFGRMLYPLHALNLNMLTIQGRSDLILKLEVIKKILAIGPICLGVFLNIYAMVIGSVFTGWMSYFLNARYSGPFLNYSIWHQLKDILPSLGLAIIIALPTYLLSFIPLPAIIVLVFQLIVAAIIGLTICELLKLPEYVEIKGIARSFVNKVLRK